MPGHRVSLRYRRKGVSRRKAGLARANARRAAKVGARRRVYGRPLRRRRMRRRGRRMGHLVSGGKVAGQSYDTFTYGDSMNVASSVAAIAYKSYWANTPVTVSYLQDTTSGDTSNADALITGDRSVNGSAKGVDEVQSIYSDYRVLSSKCKMTFINYAATGTGTAILWGYVQYAHHPRHVRPTDMDSVINCKIPGFRYVVVANRNTGNWKSLTLKYSIRRQVKEARRMWQLYSNTTPFIAGVTLAPTAASVFGLTEGPRITVDAFTSTPAGTVATQTINGTIVPPVEFVFGVLPVSETTTELSGRLIAQLQYNVVSSEPADIDEDDNA